MATNYDTAIVLSHHLDKNGAMTVQTKERLDLGIRHYHSYPGLEGRCRTLTLSGGAADVWTPTTHAGVMKSYALGQRVLEEHLLTEEKSLDTLGQAVFTKRNVVLPHGFGTLLVISHAYHINRVRTIFDAVYGKQFEIHYEGIADTQSNDRDIISIIGRNRLSRGETEGLIIFQTMFEGIEPGSDDAFLERMMQRHPLYKPQTT